MSKEKRRVPKLRFPGFTEDWEQRKFSEITYLSGIKNKENKPYESYSISNEFGFIPQNEQFEHGGTMKTADKSMYYIVTQNSFAYNPARINVGSIGYYDKPDNVIVSSLYEVFKTTEIVNDKFLWHWFKSNQFNHLIEKYQEGGVRLYFYYDKLCKGAIELPTIDEQNKISNLLNGLDLFITLHQRKLEHLNLKKKALLQKLFPKNGERYPELRFPGFTDAWEQRKLGDTNTFFTDGNYGNDYPTANEMSDSINGVPFLRGSNLDNGAINLMDVHYITKQKHNLLTSGHTKFDDIIIAVRGSLGNCGYVAKQFIDININSQLAIIRTDKNELSGLFLIEYLLSYLGKKEINRNITGTALKQLPINSLKMINIKYPSINEQGKISILLSKLNTSITLHQRKLEHLQLQKKALLQQMFV